MGGSLEARSVKRARVASLERLVRVLGLLLLASCAACTARIEGGPGQGFGPNATSGGASANAGNSLLCQTGLTACAGVCVDLQSASDHCGACGTACTAPAVCASGSCNTACADGFEKCGDSCVNPATDAAHCGGCGKQCAVGQPCNAGVCGCPEGAALCQGQCFDPLSDALHCGDCETACEVGSACVDGACQACPGGQCVCGAGKQACGEACVDLNGSPLHCGACASACTAGQSCQAGSCQCAQATDIVCDAACVDPKTDLEHCGDCATRCEGGLPCTDGKCACPEGETLCAGACTSIDTSAQHCGACDAACPDGESCLAGKCSGAIGDACSATLATGISITEIAVYQSGKIPVMSEGEVIAEDERPADIIQGKAARVRVFVKLESGWSNRTVSARLLLAHDDLTPTYFSKRNVTQASAENSFATTFNFDVEPEHVTATTRYAVEIVECDGAAAGTPGQARFPAQDYQELVTRKTGVLKLRFIPLNANGRTAASDTARLDLYRDYLARMYPTSGVEYSVGTALNVSRTISAQGGGWGEALDQLSNLHEDEQAPNDVYYYGLFQPSDSIRDYCGGGCVAGIGYVAGTQSFARHQRVALGLSFANASSAQTLAHELGHNHGRAHAPCGGAADADGDYPYAGAKIGWWGFEAPEQLHNPMTDTDIMGYCNNQWVSDYTYRFFSDRIALLNGVQRVLPPPGGMQHFRFLLVDVTGPRWGLRRAAPRYPSGEPESADILDASGNVIATVTTYRTPFDHLGGAQVLVPEPQPGWHAVQLRGEVPLGFESSSASQP